MIAEEYGYWMKVVLGFDLLFNVLTGGDVGVFFSTRAYVNAKSDKRKGWVMTRVAIDKVFWKEHCNDSYKWEMSRKQQWMDKMTKEFGKILDKYLPSFEEQPQQVNLKLPTLKKVGDEPTGEKVVAKSLEKIKLPKLKKV